MNHPNLRPEQAELLRIMKAYIHAERDCELPPAFQAYRPLFGLALAQRVAPVIWHYLSKDQHAVHKCPADVVAIWNTYATQESAKQAQHESVFLKMYQALREGGLHPLVLKGVVCRSLYAFPTLRVSCDEDILLQEDEFEEFDILIRAWGFQREEDAMGAISYTDPESKLHVEVHFEPFRNFYNLVRKENDEFRDVFTNAVELEIAGTKILTVEPTKNLLFLMLHFLQHFSSAGAGFRMLCDIVAFMEKYVEQIDRGYLSDKLREFGLERFFVALEVIERRYLGLSAKNAIFPESADCENDISDLMDDMFASGVHGLVSKTRIQSAQVTFAALTDRAGQGNVWKTLFFPTREIMYAKYGWTSGRAVLLPIAYAVRIAKGLFRTAQGRLRGRGEDSNGEWVSLGNSRVELLRKYGILAAAYAGSEEQGK